MSTQAEKEPAGICPEFTYKEYRLKDIQKAVARYFEANLAIPIEWIREYNELAAWIKKRSK